MSFIYPSKVVRSEGARRRPDASACACRRRRRLSIVPYLFLIRLAGEAKASEGKANLSVVPLLFFNRAHGVA